MKKLLAILLSLMLIITAFAFAEESLRREEIDSDGDGLINRVDYYDSDDNCVKAEYYDANDQEHPYNISYRDADGMPYRQESYSGAELYNYKLLETIPCDIENVFCREIFTFTPNDEQMLHELSYAAIAPDGSYVPTVVASFDSDDALQGFSVRIYEDPNSSATLKYLVHVNASGNIIDYQAYDGTMEIIDVSEGDDLPFELSDLVLQIIDSLKI